MVSLKRNEVFIKQSLASDLFTAAIGLTENSKLQSDVFVKHALDLIDGLNGFNDDIVPLLRTYQYPKESNERKKLADKFFTWADIINNVLAK